MADNFIEHTFKHVDGVDVKADVVMPAGASAGQPVAILLWWHGGGLLQGTRKAMAPHLAAAANKHNLCVVSADYRLAPQARMPAILEDVGDAVRWIHSAQFKDLTRSCTDPQRLFVSGSSAGGWLALLAGSGLGFKACGLSAPPKPRGVVAIYPISDLLDPFWNTKQHPVTYMKGKIIDGEAELGPYLDPAQPVSSFSASDSPRSSFYHFMIQEALLPSLLLEGTGIEPKEFSVAHGVTSGQVTLPPTYIVHGSIDDKVPLQQATDVAQAMQAKGLDVELVVEEGKDHLYDREPHEEMTSMYAFISRHA